MADDFGYHIDHHGSLVRPDGIDGITADPAATDAAVVAAAHALRRLTLSAVSDGQFRRAFFESVIYDHVSGFAPDAGDGPAPLAGLAGIPAPRRRAVTGALALRPDAGGRLARDEAAPVLKTVDRPVFVTLPSPGYLAALGSPLGDAADIDDVSRHGAALAAIIRDEIAALAADGVAYVALANPLYVPLLTVEGRAAAGFDSDAVLAALTEADRAVFADLSVPEDFRVGLDLTDSGPLPGTGQGYDRKAAEILLDETPFRRLCVDYPADPAARFPADLVRPGIVLSLGVIDVSTPEPENVDDVLALADPIADERGDRDIAVAPNGGFAQVAAAPSMTEDQQNAKLRLVETVARYYWGNEI